METTIFQTLKGSLLHSRGQIWAKLEVIQALMYYRKDWIENNQEKVETPFSTS